MWSGKREKRNPWLEPVRLESSRGFGPSEIGRIERLVAENEGLLLSME